jgi:hypothetical protein
MVMFPNDVPAESTTPSTTTTTTTTTTPATTTTTTTTTTTPTPVDNTNALDSRENEDDRRGPKFGGWSREKLQLATEVAATTAEDERKDPTRGGNSRQVPELTENDMYTPDSLELFGQQNAGGSSIDKTFSSE